MEIQWAKLMPHIHSKKEILLPIPTPFLPAYPVPGPAVDGPLCVLLEVPKTAGNSPSKKAISCLQKCSHGAQPHGLFSQDNTNTVTSPQDMGMPSQCCWKAQHDQAMVTYMGTQVE